MTRYDEIVTSAKTTAELERGFTAAMAEALSELAVDRSAVDERARTQLAAVR